MEKSLSEIISQMDIDDLTTASTAWQQANKNAFNRNIYRWMMDQYA
jgi:hypothetical protein